MALEVTGGPPKGLKPVPNGTALLERDEADGEAASGGAVEEPVQRPKSRANEDIELSRRAVAKLEEIQHLDEDCCSICLDDFTPSDPAQDTVCGHQYHLQCIMQWAQRSRECPMCFKALQLQDAAMNELLPFGEYVPRDAYPRGDGFQQLVLGLEAAELERLLTRLSAGRGEPARRERRGHHHHHHHHRHAGMGAGTASVGPPSTDREGAEAGASRPVTAPTSTLTEGLRWNGRAATAAPPGSHPLGAPPEGGPEGSGAQAAEQRAGGSGSGSGEGGAGGIPAEGFPSSWPPASARGALMPGSPPAREAAHSGEGPHSLRRHRPAADPEGDEGPSGRQVSFGTELRAAWSGFKDTLSGLKARFGHHHPGSGAPHHPPYKLHHHPRGGARSPPTSPHPARTPSHAPVRGFQPGSSLSPQGSQQSGLGSSPPPLTPSVPPLFLGDQQSGGGFRRAASDPRGSPSTSPLGAPGGEHASSSSRPPSAGSSREAAAPSGEQATSPPGDRHTPAAAQQPQHPSADASPASFHGRESLQGVPSPQAQPQLQACADEGSSRA